VIKRFEDHFKYNTDLFTELTLAHRLADFEKLLHTL
jgi:hypothetical protein